MPSKPRSSITVHVSPRGTSIRARGRSAQAMFEALTGKSIADSFAPKQEAPAAQQPVAAPADSEGGTPD